jgi:hypothetical protein
MDIIDRVDTLEDEMGHVKRRVDDLYKAFPANDLEGHRRAHEAMIEDINTRKRLTEVIREKTISGLIWLGIVAIGTAVWKHFLTIVKLGS